MNRVLIKDVLNICDVEFINGDMNLEIKNLNIDTRTIENGQIFVAIDKGNKYIENAIKNGARGIIVEENVSKDFVEKYSDITILKVKDSIKFLQEVAKFKRDKYNIPVIAITGSVGKTSTKDIVAKVVAEKFNVLKTEGNLNNHIGLPLTILRLEDHEALVVEMGMNHFGEISVLTNIAKPTIAIITNIGTSHIGILGSRENILKAKLEILDGLNPEGKLVINNDNDLLCGWNKEYKKAITYGIENKSDVMATNVKIMEDGSTYNVGEYFIEVPVSGTHFVYNSLCAITVGRLLGIEMDKIIQGISKFELTKKRMETKEVRGSIIVNDAYNASYESIKYALEYLRNINGNRKIAVLGDVLELGEFSKELHEKIGKEVDVDILITVGKDAKYIAENVKSAKEIYQFLNNQDATDKIKEIMQKGDVILFKASNGMKFQEIIDKLGE